MLCFFTAGAQTNPITVYYSPVNMPAFLRSNYYGLFDTKLMAEDLCNLLNKATGQPYVAKPYEGKEQAGIFLLIDSKRKTGNEEGFFETDGKKIIRISSRYTTGISYALYSWLEELGFHFYLPGDKWTIIPQLSSVFNRKQVKKSYQPYFHLRLFNTSGGSFSIKGIDEKMESRADWQLWYQRNRMGCDYIRIDGHMGEAFNAANRKEIENDSLIVAPVNGKRKFTAASKLDPTYDKGVNLFSDWIVNQFKKEQSSWPTFLPFKKYYSVDAGDGYDYCHTPACEAAFKSVSDQVFSIANKTATKIKQVNPLAGVSTLAYTERADTPAIKIAPNVHTMIVPSAFQTVGTNAELIQRWAKKSKNISVYDYLNIGIWSYDMPFYNLNQYFNYLQFLKSLSVEGLSFENSVSKFGSGVQQFFILQYLCKPYISFDKSLDDFCKNSFGPAATPVKKLLREWYCSDVHLQTLYDHPCFYEDELGRFIRYINEASSTQGITHAIEERIRELKIYTIYLCKYYELFCDLKSQKLFSTNPATKIEKVKDLLHFTWHQYYTRIFQNTQLSDMLIKLLPEEQQRDWNYNNMSLYETNKNAGTINIDQLFEDAALKYLPAAADEPLINEAFFEKNIDKSADSILITTTDENGLNNFMYPVSIYNAVPGNKLVIKYQTGKSQIKHKADKVALAGIESNDYRFIQSVNIYKENSEGLLQFQLPKKGFYKLYLSQFNGTHISYTIYPGKSLFYHHKKSIPATGIILQDNSNYPNKYLGIYYSDKINFSNMYADAHNTSAFYNSNGSKLIVSPLSEQFMHSISIPQQAQNNFVYYENNLYRWQPVLKSGLSYYFFLKTPMGLKK